MKEIRLLVMDVDGTLTDGKIYMGANGEQFKKFDIKDGYGISIMLKEHKIVPVVITGRSSEIVWNRCKELGIEEVYQGCKDKKTKLLELASKYNLNIDECGVIHGCAYIGDDLIDLPCMQMSEYSACPSNAVHEVKEIAKYICETQGGDGAVREFINWLISLSS